MWFVPASLAFLHLFLALNASFHLHFDLIICFQHWGKPSKTNRTINSEIPSRKICNPKNAMKKQHTRIRKMLQVKPRETYSHTHTYSECHCGNCYFITMYMIHTPYNTYSFAHSHVSVTLRWLLLWQNVNIIMPCYRSCRWVFFSVNCCLN